MKKLLILLILSTVFYISNAQSYVVPRGLPFSDTRGWINYKAPGGFILLDSLAMFRSIGDTQMKPLYPALAYISNFDGDSTYWVWDMIRWKKISDGGSITIDTTNLSYRIDTLSDAVDNKMDTAIRLNDSTIRFCKENGTLCWNVTLRFGSGTITDITGTDNYGFHPIVSSPTASTRDVQVSTLLTLGSVPFIGTAGALRENNPKFFWDSTNARLGIGKNTPLVTLNVRGQSVFENNYTLNGDLFNDRMMQINDTITSDNGTADRFARGLFGNIVTAGSVNINGSTSEVMALQGNVKYNADITVREGIGVLGRSWAVDTNTVIMGVGVQGQITASTGALQRATQLTAVEATLYHQGGTITAPNLYYLRTRDTNQALAPMVLNIDTAYGLYIHNVSAGDSINYGIYQTGTAPVNVFNAITNKFPNLATYSSGGNSPVVLNATTGRLELASGGVGTGTVTSVGITGSDFTITNSPITTSGNIGLTLATVNSNVGTFGSATQVAQVTVNAKGLTTAATNVTITPAASSITGGAALTKVDDTNVTLTLGGTPSTALLAASSLTLGWTGQLGVSRGGTGAATLTGVLVGNGTSAITGTAIAQGDVFYGSASGTLSALTKSATAGFVLTNGGTSNNPAWGAPIALTTTGSSGVATYSGGTLNVPNYGAGFTNSVVFDSLTWISAVNYNILPTNSEATNTTNAVTAIRYLINHGGGTLYFPWADSAYKVAIVIPTIPSDSICPIRILGATPVERRAGTVNVANTIPTRGVILKSSSTTASAAVIKVSTASYVTLRLENLDIRTYDQPQIDGVNVAQANRCDILNCIIETGVFNTQALVPLVLTYGIRTPILGNGASTIIRNTVVCGYYVGIDANEHTSGEDVDIYSCVNAIRVEAGNHAINFARLGMYRCTYGIYGIGANVINVTQMNIEHSDASCDGVGTTWQRTTADVKDSANLLSGDVVWWSTLCNAGTHHLFTVSGGTGIATSEAGKAFSSTQNTSNIYYNQGLVSIGTTTTTDANGNVALTVQGADAKTAISATNGTVAMGMFIQNSATAPATIGTTTNHGFGFFINNGSPSMVINTSGNTSIAANISSTAFRTTNAGSDVNAKLGINTGGSLSTAGTLAYGFDNTNGFVFEAANGTREIARAAIKLTSLTNTAGSEAGTLSFYTQTGGAAIAENMRLTNLGGLSLTGTNTAGGTTGNQTINKPTGTVNIAATGTTVTVTNSLVTTSSLVFCEIRTNDATARIANVVPGSGSFVINLTAATTAEISIGFLVINDF